MTNYKRNIIRDTTPEITADDQSPICALPDLPRRGCIEDNYARLLRDVVGGLPYVTALSIRGGPLTLTPCVPRTSSSFTVSSPKSMRIFTNGVTCNRYSDLVGWRYLDEFAVRRGERRTGHSPRSAGIGTASHANGRTKQGSARLTGTGDVRLTLGFGLGRDFRRRRADQIDVGLKLTDARQVYPQGGVVTLYCGLQFSNGALQPLDVGFRRRGVIGHGGTKAKDRMQNCKARQFQRLERLG